MPPQPGWAFERVTVQNTTERPLTFVLEPWANEHPIAPGEHITVEAEGPSGPDARLEVFPPEDDYLVVWSWAGSRARATRADGTVLDDFAAQIPRVLPSPPVSSDVP
jgi:hypothetical protein